MGVIVYLLLAFIEITIYQFVKNKRNKLQKCVLYFLMLVFLTFVQGFRDGVGADYINYTNNFNNFPVNLSLWELLINYSNQAEPLYLFFQYIIYIFSDNVLYFFFYTSLIQNLIFLFFINEFSKTIDCSIGLIIYTLVHYLYSFNALRQGLAIVICLYSLKYLLSNNLIKYFVCVLIASTIHSHAWIVLPMVLGVLKFNHKVNIIIILFFVLVLYFLNNPLFFLNLQFLGSKQLSFGDSGFGVFIFRLPIWTIFIFKMKIMDEKDKNVAQIAMLLSLFASLLNIYNAHLWRVVLYYSSYDIWIFSNLMTRSMAKSKFKDLGHLRFISVLIYLYYIFYFVYIFAINKSDMVLPYQTIFR